MVVLIIMKKVLKQAQKKYIILHFLKEKNLLNDLKNGVISVKEKKFVSGKSAVMCSKHFNKNDLNQSDLLRQKLMPNSKVLVHLNAGVFPTIFSQQGSNQTLNRSQRSSRKKLQNMVNSVTAKTSTPKKNNNSCNNIETYIYQNVNL